MSDEKWKVRKGRNGGTFVCVDGSPVGIPQEVCRLYNCSMTEQRAKLIANAPAMRELIAEMRTVLETCADILGAPTALPEELWASIPDIDAAWNAAQTVINKSKELTL